MEKKNCKQCQKEFEITNDDLEFYKKISPTFDGKTFEIPSPTLCPDCRLQRRLIFRHGGKFFRRKCDSSGKDIISMYGPEKKFKVFEQNEWWSDEFDATQFGRDFDFSKTLSEQLQTLFNDVPHASLINVNSENSYFCNHGLNQKTCYLITGATNNEDCLYGYFITGCKSTMDGVSLTGCEFCYEGIASLGCNNCKYFYNCRDCADSIMIEECHSCHDCIGCFGLRHKEYCIYNESVGKEKYEEFVKENLTPLTQAKIDAVRSKFDEMKFKLPHIQSHNYNCENTTGDMNFNCKNCKHAFNANGNEDSKFIAFNPKSKTTYDATFNAPDGTEFSYEVASSVGVNGSLFDYLCWYCNNVHYSTECYYSNDLFGCVGLKHKQYCILNKQYSSKEDYEAMVAKIIEHMKETGEWGEYFKVAFSPFAYNESLADDFFPLTREKALEKGLTWSDYEPPRPTAQKIIKAVDVPEDIAQVQDEILQSAIECEISGRLFIITEMELALYRYLKIPLPHRHPDQRHKDRMKLRAPIRLWTRKCANCNKDMETVYSPDRPEIVYCESCYLKEVY